MNDLLSYLIMLNGDKAVSHNYSHYAPLSISKSSTKITLPPITSYVSLTENNLHSLQNAYYPNENSNAGVSDLNKDSSAPSLTSDSSRLFSSNSVSRQLPLSSPSPRHLSFGEDNNEYTKKRRQRLGPSCDSCRSRKVKCNAEVLLITRQFSHDQDLEETAGLSSKSLQMLKEGEIIESGDYRLIVSNNKLIKFKPCLSCATKKLDCCFSKGFTKEDIVHTKRSGDDDVCEKRQVSPTKVTKKKVELAGARKSSCNACRKRKVKCVMNSKLSKCIGCLKKGGLCEVS